ncbi:MAG: four helix bundle protein [Bacteroidota bacterium]
MFLYPFERLEVWQLSIDLTVNIYACTETFPTREQYGLSQQVRRAAVSISSNLSEGSGRISKKDQAHFFNMAYSSLMEVLNQLILANRIGYIKESNLISIRSSVEILPRKIASLWNATLNAQP